ncbi:MULTISPECIES: ribosome silencing factor [unclassified Acidovorax]|uniref:ribosome silencing factor n=1 Tax=unclassified Acidovorax TaxID=2684926 RepID=UPI00288317A3|nr:MULTISPECIES: ribosome silencing factor [unclassified Acidovorax]
MTTSSQSESAAKKDVTKLQRAIVDGLEDVKAQDVQVFNTEHLSPLFERVIVASGTSNRQTKALASSVRDAVREAGFPKPRIEGEENGEWIIVDCGAAVAHIMQPAIRAYYRLEEIWGDKPVRLKLGAPKPVVAEKAVKPKRKKADVAAKAEQPARKPGASRAKPATAAAAPSAGRKTAAGKTTTAKSSTRTPVKTVAQAPVKTSTRKASTSTRAPVKTAAKVAAKAPAKTAAKPVKTLIVKPITKKAAPAKTVTRAAPRAAAKAPAQRAAAPAAKKAPGRKG